MNSFNKALQKLCNAIFKGFYLFAAFTFTVLLTILLINVISRNLLGGSIAWIEEISRYIFTWMMFMGIAIGVHYKKHLGVEFVVGLYPAKVKKAAYFISDVLTLVLFIILAIYGFRYAGKSMKMFSPIMGIPYGIVYLCVPIGAIFSTFYCFARIIEDYFMIVLFLALAIFLGTPIAVALGLAAVAELILQGEVPLMIAAQRIFNGVNSVTLMGIPFFMLVGSIMERSGITQKLIDFANSLVGWLRGGLCYVGVLTGILMGGISGSAPADTAALSSIMVPSMERSGYDREFSAALMASSGTLGIIIPPSMPMIVLASITGISVGKLFLGGIIPGCMIGLSFMIICGVTCHIRGYDKDHKIRLSLREIGRTFFHALLPILAPVIIVGGILTGIVTATESAIAAVAYTLIVALFIYRSMSLKDLPELFVDSVISASNVMFIIGTSSLFAWIMQSNNFQDVIISLFGNSVHNQLWVMFIVNLVFFIGGFFLEGTAMQIMFIPVLLPIVQAAGINEIAFGVTVICNIAIGNLTPPVGVCLYVAANSSHAKVEGIIKNIAPFVLMAMVDIGILMVFPQLITLIPDMMH